jgi:hypothetical protein
MFIEVTAKETGHKYLFNLQHIVALGPNPDDTSEVLIATDQNEEFVVVEDYATIKNLLSL